MRRITYILGLTVAMVALLVPASAQASPRQIFRDCVHDGRLDGRYTLSDLKKAKRTLPADVAEYSDCEEVITAALNGGPGAKTSGNPPGGGGPGSGGASGPGAAGAIGAAGAPGAAGADAQALQDATKNAQKPGVRVGDKVVKPGKNGLFGVAGVPNGMPMPLTIALLVIAVMAVGVGAFRVGRRIPLLAGLSVPRPRVSLPRLKR